MNCVERLLAAVVITIIYFAVIGYGKFLGSALQSADNAALPSCVLPFPTSSASSSPTHQYSDALML